MPVAFFAGDRVFERNALRQQLQALAEVIGFIGAAQQLRVKLVACNRHAQTHHVYAQLMAVTGERLQLVQRLFAHAF